MDTATHKRFAISQRSDHWRSASMQAPSGQVTSKHDMVANDVESWRRGHYVQCSLDNTVAVLQSTHQSSLRHVVANQWKVERHWQNIAVVMMANRRCGPGDVPGGTSWVGVEPLVWTAVGRPHPAVTRTVHHAADMAACWNGQQMSATALKHRWKHEVQIALFWRRVAFLSMTSAREQWMLRGLVDKQQPTGRGLTRPKEAEMTMLTKTRTQHKPRVVRLRKRVRGPPCRMVQRDLLSVRRTLRVRIQRRAGSTVGQQATRSSFPFTHSSGSCAAP